jgi:hypothetical protein
MSHIAFSTRLVRCKSIIYDDSSIESKDSDDRESQGQGLAS